MKILSNFTGKHHTEESRLKMSEAKMGDKNPFYGKHHTTYTKRRISKKLKGKKHPNYGKICPKEVKEKTSKTLKGKYCGKDSPTWKGGKVKVNCKQCGKEKEVFPCLIKNTGNFCSNRCKAIYKTTRQKTTGTDIELLMEAELIRRNISFTPQKPLLNLTVVDFFIEPNIVIYCDGIYWHNLEKVKEKDERQNLILSSNGYKVFRFTNKDINKSVKNCVNKVLIKEEK